MTEQTTHVSVLLHEAVEALDIVPDGIYVDGTFGRGGHSKEILERLGERGRLYAIDRDPTAIEAAKAFSGDPRFEITHSAFSHLESVADSHEILGNVDGLLLDLGVSSPQLDESERGFSFMRDGPLDMRMDTSKGLTAEQWINEADVEDISFVLKTYGEERQGWKIAQKIVAERAIEPITRTGQLAQMIKDVAPKRDEKKHPATRSFQAIRIYINSELEEIKKALDSALQVLKPGGRLVVISFHSLEDRMVKQFIRKHSKPAPIPRGLPIRDDEIEQNLKLKAIGKAIKPSQDETQLNVRARSSVLRIAERR